MNKYQNALEELCSRCYVESEKCTCHARYKGGKCNNNCEHRQALQELIDKETPMKVKYLSDDFLLEPYNVKCPYCDYILGKDFIPTNEREKTYHQYCCRCGQRLDWSGDDE